MEFLNKLTELLKSGKSVLLDMSLYVVAILIKGKFLYNLIQQCGTNSNCILQNRTVLCGETKLTQQPQKNPKRYRNDASIY